MKKIYYIAFACIAGYFAAGCTEDPIERTLSGEESFVTFETRSGGEYSYDAYENDTVIIKVSAAVTGSEAFTVAFAVASQVGIPATAAQYEILDMNDVAIPANPYHILTFPGGAGVQSFKFIPKGDGVDLENDRTFVFQLKGNSAGYKQGFAKTDGSVGGAEYPVTVRDDVAITIDELVGTWEVTEDIISGSTVYAGEIYTVEVEHIGGDSIKIYGVAGGDPVDAVKGCTFLGKGINKYIEIRAQDFEVTWNDDYITRFAALHFSTFAQDYDASFVEDYSLRLSKAGNGTISLAMRGGLSPYSYVVLALDPDDRSVLGSFLYARNSRWVKLP
jgi:hypothetical protein